MPILVHDQPFDSAKEFLIALSPFGERFEANYPHSQWMFRGVGSDEHKLIPSALRENSRLNDFIGVEMKREGYHSQVAGEIKAAHRFFRAADKHGLPLPEDSQIIRGKLDALDASFGGMLSDNIEIWPPIELRSLLGLAQHYGVPTRLLDWTRSPLVAAYFAAVSREENAKHILVWALDSCALDEHKFHEEKGRVESRHPLPQVPLDVVTAPSAGNPNLAAQQGLFTLFNQLDANGPVDRRPLDQVLLDEMQLSWEGRLPILIEFRLRVDCSGELLWWLAKHDVTAAKLFPGYGGVVRSLVEERHWEYPAFF